MPRIETPFTARSTAADVARGIDLDGRPAIVTGGASGIGVETARALSGAGAAVTLAVRDLDAGRRVAEDIAATTGRAVDVRRLDLADLRSVDAFVADWTGPLHILVNNAGVMTTPEAYTPEGWERQFATNHLGHFALAVGLHGALAADGAARIVVVSSSGHGNAPVDLEDLGFARRPYDASVAYGQSKTANVLFAVEATNRWRADGITANALMPGGIWTALQRHWDPDVLAQAKASAGDAVKTPEQGAATSVMLATSPIVEGVGGRYFEDCHEAEVVDSITDGLHGVRAYALDPDAARRLWEVSTALIDAARRSQSPAPLRTVRRLLRAIGEQQLDAAAELLAPDVTFVNGTVETVTGRDEVIAALRPAVESMDEVDWPVLHAASVGSTCFVERVDRFRRATTWAEIAVTAVFELDADGRIASWRDSFDPAAGARALGGLPEPADQSA